MAWCIRALLAVVMAGAIACGGGGGEDNGGSSGNPTGPSDGGSNSGSCTRPDPPTGVNAAVSNNNVFFTWNAVSGATQYDLLVGTSSGASNVMAINTTRTDHAWNGVSSGRYYVRVEAKNQCGNGRSSNEVSFQVGG